MLNIFLSILKSLYYDIRLFGLRGASLPIIFFWNVKLHGVRKGAIEVGSGRVHIGGRGSKGLEPHKHTYIIIGEEGKLIFNGCANVAAGTTIRVDAGVLTLGNNFHCNTNCLISCTRKITIGNNVLLGWNVSIRDSDGHTIIHDNDKRNSLKPVIIGNHVWVCAYVDILKGVSINNDCVIAYRSCVTKSFKNSPNSLIAGYPAKIIQQNINWEQ